MAVLSHPDSRWDRNDFDAFPIQRPVPHFLQPAHEPHMRIPALTSPWCGGDWTLSATEKPLLSGLDHEVAADTEKITFPPRAEQDRWYQPARSMVSSPHLSKPLDDGFSSQCNNTQTWPLMDQAASMDPSQLTFGGPLHTSLFPSWQDSGHDQTLGEGHSTQLFVNDVLFDNVQLAWSGRPIESLGSPSLLGRSESITALSPHQLAPAHRPESILAPDPLCTYTEKHDLAMPPPSRKRNHYDTHFQSQAQGQHISSEEFHQAEYDPGQATADASPLQTASKRGRAEGTGSYIHGLCGKAFRSRYKVRKHHWGNDVDNMNTTTGCWYKHKRPDCSWDDHPSCKEQPKAPASIRQKAGPAPRQQRNSTGVVILPELEHAQQHLAAPRELYTTIEQHDDKPASPIPYANKHVNHSTYIPYHTHTLPASSSPFESLLTAVNLAAEIESPIPQRRNDSVVASNLNAYAIAAERTGECNTNWFHNEATLAQTNSMGYNANLSRNRRGILPSMGSASVSVASSMSPRLAHPSLTHSEDHSVSTQEASGARYRHSYLNSRNPVAWPPN